MMPLWYHRVVPGRKNQEKMIKDMNIIQEYLKNNQLTMNQTKTKIVEAMVPQKRSKIKGTPPPLPDHNKHLWGNQDCKFR